MKKMNRWLQRCKAAGKTFLAAFAVFLLNTQTAYASGISESKLAKGTEKLIGDATTWLMVLAPVVAGLLIIYFCIRRSAADEMDQKKWNNRIVVITSNADNLKNKFKIRRNEHYEKNQ